MDQLSSLNMYEEVIENLKAAEAQSSSDLADFVALINKYADMGLLIQVHNHRDGDDASHSLRLTYEVSSSVHIVKTIEADGTVTDWTPYDLTELLHGRD